MRKNKRNIFRTIILLAIILLPLSIALYAYYIEPFWIKTINYQISSAGINEKIVFISDTHFGENYSRENLEKVVSEINAQNPDLVILGGDYIDKNPKYTAEYFEIIKKLEAKDGIFAVLGNHDMNSHLLSKVKAGLQLDNINLLENKNYILEKDGKKIRIAGVSDYNFGEPNANKAIGNDIQSTDFVILISHNPDYFEEYKEKKANLYLAGHEHGGQIGLPFWYPLLPSQYGNKYLGGKVFNDERNIIVSKGIGMSIFPFRFGARPDITVINLN